MNFTTLEELTAFTGKLIHQECDSQYGDLKKREPTRAEVFEALFWLLYPFARVDQIEADLAVHHSLEHMPPEDGFRKGHRNYRFRREIVVVRALCETSTRIVVGALQAVVDLEALLMLEVNYDDDYDLTADLVSLTGYVRELIDFWKPTVDKREYNGHMAGAMSRRRARAAHLRWCGRIFAAVCSMVWPDEMKDWCDEIRAVFDQDLEQFDITFVMDGQATYKRIELNPHEYPDIKKTLLMVRRLRGDTKKA